jgi:hypothetical protein
MTRKKIDVFGLVLTSACLLWAIILCIVDFSWATFGGALFVAGLIVLTWILVRRSKPVDHSTHDGHHVMLWDAAPYTCIHGVKPHKVTKQCAWPIAHDSEIPEPTDDQRWFRKYPRP